MCMEDNSVLRKLRMSKDFYSKENNEYKGTVEDRQLMPQHKTETELI